MIGELRRKEGRKEREREREKKSGGADSFLSSSSYGFILIRFSFLSLSL